MKGFFGSFTQKSLGALSPFTNPALPFFAVPVTSAKFIKFPRATTDIVDKEIAFKMHQVFVLFSKLTDFDLELCEEGIEEGATVFYGFFTL